MVQLLNQPGIGAKFSISKLPLGKVVDVLDAGKVSDPAVTRIT